ncbi:hypothetical protein DUNSADRAFT_15857 [Dunaliella salina]|uniref:Secreted protein n=1 Tax=Dunaliella salina TaxID=3046 RepID=A0ABQ7G4S4_DUNSA|nr:hypothetical protein DUNSADRAFT_15857 [Dunaliella salina]|eukprot:KAF5829592.1 hypothetical protein DUNSADRAFT_15857 [Dunaliella salina]
MRACVCCFCVCVSVCTHCSGSSCEAKGPTCECVPTNFEKQVGIAPLPFITEPSCNQEFVSGRNVRRRIVFRSHINRRSSPIDSLS